MASLVVKPRGQGWNSDLEEGLEGQQAHVPLPNLANIPQGREERQDANSQTLEPE